MVAGDEGSADKVVLALGEMLMINASTATSVGTVTKVFKGKITLTLRLPICADVASRVTLSRVSTQDGGSSGMARLAGEPVPDLLIDACGWVAAIDARINIDLEMERTIGQANWILPSQAKKKLTDWRNNVMTCLLTYLPQINDS